MKNTLPFVWAKAGEIDLFDYKPDEIVWHCTDGPGFLGIVQSASIYATQVAFNGFGSILRFVLVFFASRLCKEICESRGQQQNHRPKPDFGTDGISDLVDSARNFLGA